MKDITIMDWIFAVIFGVLFIANISTGRPFVLPVSGGAFGHDISSGLIWFLFFWSLQPFVPFAKKFLGKRGAQ
jgi:hypothetical protein